MAAVAGEMPEARARSQRALAIGCLLALCACVCVLHREVLLGGSVYHMDDAADGYYPGHIAVARAFAHGELPTWERGSWCGWPLVVDPYNGVFYPPNVIYYALGAARGLGFAIALHVLLGGAGVWLLLRRRGLAAEIALFGALAYGLSSFGVVRIRHVIFVQMMGWLPWILVGVEGFLQSRRRRELVLVAAATGLALIAGALSIGHFAALVIAAYTVARAAASSGAAPPGQRLRRLLTDTGALAGAAAIGALLAAVQLAPTLAHLPYSPRSLGSDYAFASSYAWPDLRWVWTLLAPDEFGTEERFHYYGAPNHWELCGWYVGVLAAGAAPLALAFPRRGRGAQPERWVLAALVALAIALALGDAAPVHPWFFRHVPLYAALRCPARALLIAVLALPILGAEGIAGLLERARAPKRPLAAGGGWLAAAALATAGALIARKLDHPPRGDTPAHTAYLAAWGHVALVAGGGLAILAAALFGRLKRDAAGALLCAIAALDLLAIDRPYLQPQPADYPQGMERFAAIEWLRANAEGARFVNDPGGPFRLNNVGMVYDLENAVGYDSVSVWRYIDLLYLINNGQLYPDPKLKHDFAAIGLHDLGSRLLDLMNVRWLIAERPPPGPSGARWVERFAPKVPSGAPAARYEPHWDAVLHVYENPDVLPRAFVAYGAESPVGDQRLAARLLSRTFDPGRTVLLEVPAPLPLGPPRPPTPATFDRASRHELVIDARAEQPGLLFVGDVWYPGWSVTVDGQPAPLLRADFAFRAVALAPGQHRVVMRYASRPVRVGAALSLAGLLALGALGWRRRRKP